MRETQDVGSFWHCGCQPDRHGMFYTQAALDEHGAIDMRPMIRIQEELLAKWQMYRGPITVVAVV